MARKTENGVNKSEEVRQHLKANPGAKAGEVVEALAAKGIEVQQGLVYLIKGKIKGGKKKRKAAVAENGAALVASAPRISGDPLATVLKVQALAADLGGIKKLRALIEALSV